MRILVLGGAGAMGMVTVRDLVESPRVSEVIVGDVAVERVKQLATWVASEKLSVKRIDVLNHGNLVEAMRQADAVANATPYHLNLEVTKAAVEAKKNLVDLGGVYYMTLKQLELDDVAKKAGVSIVLGCGIAPGVADILAKYGADKLDRVEEVHIEYGDVNLTPAKYKWTLRTVLEEYTSGPVVYQGGEFKKMPPFSGKRIIKFPEPIGVRSCCYSLYSGIATLPYTIDKGVRAVDCVMSYTEEDEQRIMVLSEMGLTSKEPVKVGDISVSPREVLLRCAPPPDTKVKDFAGIIVEVTGEKDKEGRRYVYSIIHKYNEKYDVSATAYLTGVPLSIVSQMLARGDIRSRGVLPPEVAVDAEMLIAELNKRGISIHETLQRTRIL